MARDFLSDYAGVSHNALNGRDLEASVLLKASGKLRRCCRNWDAIARGEKIEELEEALHYNQRLWTVLQAELGSPSNPLPDEIRVNLLRLSRYIDRTTFECLLKAELSKLEMLARINENLAEGLQTQTAQSAPPEPVQQQEKVSWSL